ncbi:MAG TPA: YceK/YidQ family lipoprotein [Verrucomicrobiae bacterium]|nr:YceK/YidQ family lipoprotein [Verrucomicrobiae bacterium]
MKISLNFIGAAAAILFCTGCTAIYNRESSIRQRPYAGVRDDVYYLAHPREADLPPMQWANAFDLPFSALLDTAFLPYDLMYPPAPPQTNSAVIPKPAG